MNLGIAAGKIVVSPRSILWEGSGKIRWIFCFGSADGVLLYRSTIFLAMGALFVDHNHGASSTSLALANFVALNTAGVRTQTHLRIWRRNWVDGNHRCTVGI